MSFASSRFRASNNFIGGNAAIDGDLVVSGSLIVLGGTAVSGTLSNAANIGSGHGVFAHKDGTILSFRSLVAAGSITLLSGANEITISASVEPSLHALSHQDGGADELIVSNLLGELADPQKVAIRVNNGVNIGARPRLNFLSGSGISISASDDLVNDEIDILISADVSASGEDNTASNIGIGQGIFAQKTGVDLQFRSLLGSGSISVLSGTNEITIFAPTQVSYSVTNTGSGEGTYSHTIGSQFVLRSLTGSGATSVLSGANGTIIISSSDTGEVNTASNIGIGEGIFAQKNAFDLQFRSLLASGSVSLISSSNAITIFVPPVVQVSYSVANTGSGVAVYSHTTGSQFILKTITGSGATSISELNGVIIVSSSDTGETNTASNTGSGEGVFLQKIGTDLVFRSLQGLGSVSVLSGANGTILISGSTTISAGQGTITNAQNIGLGQGVYATTSGSILQFRSLIGSGGVSVISGSDSITIYTTPGGGTLFEEYVQDDNVTVNGQTTFTLDLPPVDPNDVVMYVNGHAYNQFEDFTVSGTSITWLNASFSLETSDEVKFTYSISSSQSPGEANTAANIGPGQGWFANKTGVVLNFRTLLATGSVSLISGSDYILISGSSVGSGDVTNAANTGSGQGIFLQKSGSILEFRSITGSGGTTVLSGANGTIIISSSATQQGGAGTVFEEYVQDTIVTTNGQTAFVLDLMPVDANDVVMYVNGFAYDKNEDYSVVGTSVTWLDNPFTLAIGDEVKFTYSISSSITAIIGAANIGAGEGWYANTSGSILNFRTILATGSVSIISGSDTITISGSQLANSDLINGVRHFSSSLLNPTFPTPNQGDIYYNTFLEMEMRYDGSRSKWLSVEAAKYDFGRGGFTAKGSFYKNSQDITFTATRGYVMPFSGTIISLTFFRENSDSVVFEILSNGITIAALSSSAMTGSSTTLNADFARGEIISIRNQFADGNTAKDVTGFARVKWRR